MAIKAKYTEQVIVLVTEDMRKRLDALAERQERSVSHIVRKALELALPELEQ